MTPTSRAGTSRNTHRLPPPSTSTAAASSGDERGLVRVAECGVPARLLEVELVAVVAVAPAERGEQADGETGDDPHRRAGARAARVGPAAATHPRRAGHAAILARASLTPAGHPGRRGGWHSEGVQRFTGLDAVPAGFGPSVVTIGNFDGVHRGHQAVLAVVVGRGPAVAASRPSP